MLGLLGTHANAFLVLLGISTFAALGLPMLVSPIAWSRILGWRTPVDTDLTIYFGRCLAAVICVLCGAAVYAAAHPEVASPFFNLLTANFALMIAIHVYGALKRIQPRAETYEIGLWVVLLACALLFRPRLGDVVLDDVVAAGSQAADLQHR